MTAADLDRVVSAEARSHPFPWTRRHFADSLAAGHDALVAREDGEMIGYAVTMRILDEAHLLDITVLPELQRQGRGTQFLLYLLSRARQEGAARMLLEVRASNGAAQAVYLKQGFVIIGRRPGYYSVRSAATGIGTQREDAIVMACKL